MSALVQTLDPGGIGNFSRRLVAQSGVGGTFFDSSHGVGVENQWEPPEEITMLANKNPSNFLFVADYRLEDADPTFAGLHRRAIVPTGFKVDFARVRPFCYSDGSGPPFQHFAQPFIQDAPRGNPVTTAVGNWRENPVPIDFDFYTDFKGVPWTTQTIDAIRWGIRLFGSATDPTAQYGIGMMNFLVELWASPIVGRPYGEFVREELLGRTGFAIPPSPGA